MQPNAIKQDILAGNTVAGAMVFEFFSPGISAILANVEEIAAVDGVDVLWVGHFDLSNFLGIPGQFDDPRFDAAMRKVVAACRRHGKAAGFLATDGAWIERAREMGYTMIAGGTDNGLLQQAFSQQVAQIEGRVA